jgi:hypothetical protein
MHGHWLFHSILRGEPRDGSQFGNGNRDFLNRPKIQRDFPQPLADMLDYGGKIRVCGF